MMDHHPRLTFFVVEPADCNSVPGCEASGSVCTCAHTITPGVDPLVGKQISLEILPTPSLASDKPKSALPDRALPSESREAGGFSYVANLSQEPFGLTVNPIYLEPQPSTEAKARMVARMEVPYKEVTACALATREDGGEANVHSMSFRALGDQSDSGEVSYALAQKVVAELMVPDGGAGGQTVKLHISDFGGANDHVFTLKPGSDAYRIDVGNDPDRPLGRDNPCDDGVARHFKHFYALALNPPGSALIPHVRPTQFKSAVPLQPKTCKDPIFGLANRPICPVAAFNP